MPDALAALPDPFTGLLVRFAARTARGRARGRLRRRAGLLLGAGRLDPTDLVDLYWAGRTTLVSRHDDIARYDEVFRRFFLGADGPDEELAAHAARVGAGPGDAGDPGHRAAG